MILDPEKTALVIVDMQNYFLDERCMDHPNGLKAIEPTIRVLDACRKGDVQVCSLKTLFLDITCLFRAVVKWDIGFLKWRNF